MVKRREEFDDEVLAGQIPEFTENVEKTENNETTVKDLGKLSFMPGDHSQEIKEAEAFDDSMGGTKLGENIFEKAEAREGWITIDRRLLGERNRFYPSDWTFMVRPATVEAIRNWSMLDENNGNSIDDVFNEILKYCLSIKTSMGVQPWQAINNWDRLFFILLIREYTFVKGENNIEFFEDCENCESQVRFTVESQALMYDMPDEDVLKYYDEFSRTWLINPMEFGVDYNRDIMLYIPTIERDANIKAWLISEYQENDKKKLTLYLLSSYLG
jgi:hypothetical protein